MQACSHFCPVSGSPETEPKELQVGVRHSTNLRLLFVEFQEQLSFNVGFKAFKGAFRRHMPDEVLVHQLKVLPRASFSLYLAVYTLPLAMRLPLPAPLGIFTH